MLFLLYHCLALCCLPFLLLFAVLHILYKPRYALFYLQRFSLVLPGNIPRTRRRVWIHAVSVGEVLSCAPLIRRLQKDDFAVYLSTGTQLGFQAAKTKYAGVEFFYFPFDIFFVMNRFVKRIDPDVVLLCELEIWPAFVRSVHQHDIPLYLVSGRMGDGDFRSYLLFKWFFKHIFPMFTGLFMQSEEYARRMRQICSHDNIKTLGNVKFDSVWDPVNAKIARLLPEGLLVCAASTHKGDEDLIIRAYKRLTKEFSGTRLIIAPRHVHRVGEIIRLLKKNGLEYTLRSRNQKCLSQVFLVDTVGELMGIYAKCHLVIMGGSFSKRTGGHNIIEPALHKRCILCGNHMENFRDIHHMFKQANALFPTSSNTLPDDLKKLLKDQKRATVIGEKAFSLVEKNRGVSEQIYREVFNRIPVDSQADPEKSMHFAPGR
jgi:3-deoxy-D-manno-octulosonic-acid transferase